MQQLPTGKTFPAIFWSEGEDRVWADADGRLCDKDGNLYPENFVCADDKKANKKKAPAQDATPKKKKKGKGSKNKNSSQNA